MTCMKIKLIVRRDRDNLVPAEEYAVTITDDSDEVVQRETIAAIKMILFGSSVK